MRLNRVLLLLCLVGLGFTLADRSANAATGSLDTTFGQGGVAVTTLTTASGINDVIPFSVHLQSDSKILVIADVINGTTATSDVLRYTNKGELDTTFGSGGIAVLPATLGPASLALQPNGQIVVAGINGSGFTVERLNTDGSIDNSFGNGGVASASLGSRTPGVQLVALIETNGDIVVVGQLERTGRRQSDQILLARFTSAGSLDGTFGAGGTTVATALSGVTALAELSTGGILVVNAQNVAQFTSTGSPDSTTGGAIVASAGSGFLSIATAFQANGDHLIADLLFVGEESRARNASAQVLRFASAGAADSAFADPSFHFSGTGGSGIEAAPNAMAVQPNSIRHSASTGR
jgi:uncharacterized delta-60 repeat protein